MIELKPIGGNQYNFIKEKFSKEFNNIDVLMEAYVNDQNKVYAAMWKDKNGVINFNSGFAPDVDKVIRFVSKEEYLKSKTKS